MCYKTSHKRYLIKHEDESYFLSLNMKTIVWKPLYENQNVKEQVTLG